LTSQIIDEAHLFHSHLGLLSSKMTRKEQLPKGGGGGGNKKSNGSMKSKKEENKMDGIFKDND
jgi:hypothetical protein